MLKIKEDEDKTKWEGKKRGIDDISKGSVKMEDADSR